MSSELAEHGSRVVCRGGYATHAWCVSRISDADQLAKGECTERRTCLRCGAEQITRIKTWRPKR